MAAMMKYLAATTCGAALLLGGCSPASTPNEAGAASVEPAPVVSDAGGSDVAADVRKADLIADYETALAAAQATTGPGMPQLWTMSDEDTTVHFFGTVHLLRPELEWRSPAFEAAFDAADTVYFEVDMKSEEAQARLMKDFVMRGMYQDGRTLRDTLGAQEEAVVEAAMDSVGVPLDAFNSFEPWMAAMNLSVMKLTADGFDPNAGVETVLEAEAVAAGKSFGYMEDISDQADAFDLMSEAGQIAFLYEGALLLDESTAMLDTLVDEWADGDVAGIGAMVANPDGVGFSDEAYQRVLVTRNENWIPVIEDILEEPGTAFVAVGAGHLAGPDSVIEMLRAKGYEVTGP